MAWEDTKAEREQLVRELKYPDVRQINVLYKLSDMLRSLPTSWLHFILVEFRSIYLVWAAGYNFAVGLKPGRNDHFWRLDNTAGYWNIPVFGYCILLNVIGLALLIRSAGMAPFTDPKYLKFTFELEEMLWYKIAVKILIIICVLVSITCYLVMVFGICIGPMADDTGTELMSTWDFVSQYFDKIVALMGMVTALEMEERKVKKQVCINIRDQIRIELDCDGEAFQSVKFTRSILDLFVQTNDAFAKKVITALWVATSSGEGDKLFQCVDEESWEEALKIKARP